MHFDGDLRQPDTPFFAAHFHFPSIRSLKIESAYVLTAASPSLTLIILRSSPHTVFEQTLVDEDVVDALCFRDVPLPSSVAAFRVPINIGIEKGMPTPRGLKNVPTAFRIAMRSDSTIKMAKSSSSTSLCQLPPSKASELTSSTHTPDNLSMSVHSRQGQQRSRSVSLSDAPILVVDEEEESETDHDAESRDVDDIDVRVADHGTIQPSAMVRETLVVAGIAGVGCVACF